MNEPIPDPAPAEPDTAAPAAPDTAVSGFGRLPGTLWWVLDAAGAIRRCSPAAGDVLGLDPEVVLGRRAADLVEPSDRALWQASLRRASTGDEVTGVGVGLRHVDGEWRRVCWTLRRCADGVSVVAFGRDQTICWCHSPRSGTPSDQLVEALLNAMPLPVFVKGVDGRYRFVNREFCRLAGAESPADVIGRRAFEIWPDLDRAFGANETEVYRQSPQVALEQSSLVVGARTMLVARQVIADGNGHPEVMIGMGTDITEIVTAEQRLAERSGILQAILACSPDIITVLDGAGRVLYDNSASAAALGYGGRTSRAGRLVDLIHPEDRSAVMSALAARPEGEARTSLRYRLRHADGRWITVDARIQFDRAGHSGESRVVVVARDISKILAAESRLRAAVAAAERASQAKSELLSRVSHELRTPLNSILGFAQLLEMDDLPEIHSPAVDAVMQAGRRLLAIVDDVLELARIDAGHVEYRPRAVPWSELVAEAKRIGSMDLALAPGVAIPEPWVDPRWFRQVLGLLVEVVRDAVGGFELRDPTDVQMEVVPHGTEQRWVRISVGSKWLGPTPPTAQFGVGEPDGLPGTSSLGLARCQYLVGQMAGHLDCHLTAVGIRFDLDVPVAGGGSGSLPEGSGGGSAVPDAGTAGGMTAGPPAGGPPAGEPLGAVPPAVAQRAVVPMAVVLVTDDPGVEDLVRHAALRRPGATLRTISWVGGIPLPDGLSPDPGTDLAAHLVLIDVAGASDEAAARDRFRLVADALTAGHRERPPVVAVLGPVGDAAMAAPYLERGADAYLGTPLDTRALLELFDSARALAGPSLR